MLASLVHLPLADQMSSCTLAGRIQELVESLHHVWLCTVRSGSYFCVLLTRVAALAAPCSGLPRRRIVVPPIPRKTLSISLSHACTHFGPAWVGQSWEKSRIPSLCLRCSALATASVGMAGSLQCRRTHAGRQATGEQHEAFFNAECRHTSGSRRQQPSCSRPAEQTGRRAASSAATPLASGHDCSHTDAHTPRPPEFPLAASANNHCCIPAPGPKMFYCCPTDCKSTTIPSRGHGPASPKTI